METTETTGAVPAKAGEPVITYDLWERLRKFDARCFVCVERRNPLSLSPFGHLSRVWTGYIRPVDEKAYDREDAEHPHFAEFVRLIVEKGEKRGWHRPKYPGM